MASIVVKGLNFRQIAKGFEHIAREVPKTFNGYLKTDAENAEKRIKKSLSTRSSGSRRVRRSEPARTAWASPIGTSPNTDLGKLEASISSTSGNMSAEVGTEGAYENGINYADYHEENGRPYIKPEVPQFESDVRKSADKAMQKAVNSLSKGGKM